jgi:hypothetical protein
VNEQALLLERTMVLGLRDQKPGGQAILPLSDMTIMLRALRGKKISVKARSFVGPLGKGERRARKGEKFTPKSANVKARRFIGPLMPGQRRLGKKETAVGKSGSTKALIDHGDMMMSIHTEKVTSNHFTVGVHKGARDKQGKSLVQIAAVHEYGSRRYSMTVTAKMARFSRFLVVMGVLRVPWHVGQVLKRKVPARPFLRPAHTQWLEGAQDRFNKTLEERLHAAV